MIRLSFIFQIFFQLVINAHIKGASSRAYLISFVRFLGQTSSYQYTKLTVQHWKSIVVLALKMNFRCQFRQALRLLLSLNSSGVHHLVAYHKHLQLARRLYEQYRLQLSGTGCLAVVCLSQECPYLHALITPATL